MANSITRYLKNIWLAFMGRTHKQSNQIAVKIEEVRNAYEVIIQAKQVSVQRWKEVIGQSLGLIEQKKGSLTTTKNDIVTLKKMIEGTENKIQNISTKLNEEDLSDDEIEQHPDYIRAKHSKDDFNTSLAEKNARVAQIEHDIKQLLTQIEYNKYQLTVLHRDIDKLKRQQSDTIADLRNELQLK